MASRVSAAGGGHPDHSAQRPQLTKTWRMSFHGYGESDWAVATARQQISPGTSRQLTVGALTQAVKSTAAATAMAARGRPRSITDPSYEPLIAVPRARIHAAGARESMDTRLQRLHPVTVGAMVPRCAHRRRSPASPEAPPCERGSLASGALRGGRVIRPRSAVSCWPAPVPWPNTQSAGDGAEERSRLSGKACLFGPITPGLSGPRAGGANGHGCRADPPGMVLEGRAARPALSRRRWGRHARSTQPSIRRCTSWIEIRITSAMSTMKPVR
jgi:hypothetical protein